MKYRGVHYDTGVHFSPKRLSREDWDLATVEYELQAVADQLHANAVRIIGEDLDRLVTAARIAADAGLTVFFNPWLINASEEQLLPYLRAAARAAEELRVGGLADICLVLSCEMTLFGHGMIPGEDVYERVQWLVSLRGGAEPVPSFAELQAQLGGVLARSVEVIRSEFGGRLTYAAGSWESVDWELFDLVSVDYYRAEQSEAEYAAGLRELAGFGKPVVVAEFGCCTYEGADRRGGMGWMDLDEWADGGAKWAVAEPPVRSEQTQVDYLTEQLRIFAAEDVEGAFVFTLVAPYLQHSEDPALDYDRSSFALVATAAPGEPLAAQVPPWRRKAAFHALGQIYERLAE